MLHHQSPAVGQLLRAITHQAGKHMVDGMAGIEAGKNDFMYFWVDFHLSILSYI